MNVVESVSGDYLISFIEKMIVSIKQQYGEITRCPPEVVKDFQRGKAMYEKNRGFTNRTNRQH